MATTTEINKFDRRTKVARKPKAPRRFRDLGWKALLIHTSIYLFSAYTLLSTLNHFQLLTFPPQFKSLVSHFSFFINLPFSKYITTIRNVLAIAILLQAYSFDHRERGMFALLTAVWVGNGGYNVWLHCLSLTIYGSRRGMCKEDCWEVGLAWLAVVGFAVAAWRGWRWDFGGVEKGWKWLVRNME